jgi:hypothetical protein
MAVPPTVRSGSRAAGRVGRAAVASVAHGRHRVVAGGLISGVVVSLAVSALTTTKAASAPYLPPGQIVVVPSPARTGQQRGLDLTIRSSSQVPAAAQLTLYVPAGYRLRSPRHTGAVIGGAGALFLRGAKTSALHYVRGLIRQGNPAKLSRSATAQACAPGRHEAVWTVTFDIGNRKVVERLFVDPTAGDETARGAYRIVACLASPYVPADQGGAPAGVRFVGLSLGFEGRLPVFISPEAAGAYVWRMLVMPYRAGSGDKDTAGTFEARARVEQPHTLTVRAAYVKRSSVLVLTGRLLALGSPRAGVRIRFYAGRPGRPLFHFGKTTTHADGRYLLRRRISPRRYERMLNVGAAINEVKAPCDSPPAAPGGCVDENLSPPPFVARKVRIPAVEGR